MTAPRADGQTVDVDLSFGDVVDDLKPSGMVFFTAKKGRLGFAADVQYAEIEAQSKALEPLLSRGTLRSTSFVLSAPANYLVFDDGRTGLRLGGGARLWSVETDLKLSDDLLPGRRVTSEDTWVDPVVGVNGVVSLGHKVFARGWAYVGGFGTVRAFPSSPPGATPKVAPSALWNSYPTAAVTASDRYATRPVCRVLDPQRQQTASTSRSGNLI